METSDVLQDQILFQCVVSPSGTPSRRKSLPKEYFPLTDQVIHDRLTGKLTAGVYPLMTDETCWFLAADFDKKSFGRDLFSCTFTEVVDLQW
ncbi:MAG: hypothetical protein DME21_05535 [Verrucomicrobia bacterium]|nr:MAG: hypothetical protein DME21_05535 [Verrucomicrobiota bacterium]